MNIFKAICLAAIVLMGFTPADAQSEARFYTSMGNFDVTLTDSRTPVTVDSFIARVSEKFYDGLLFHRVIDNFMIQGGDPNGNGTGGPGYTIPDEFDTTLRNIPGALSMANTGQPNTGGCQFFVNLVANPHLDNKHTVFGMVTDNFTVVQDIGKVATGANNRPLINVVIDSIRILTFSTGIQNAEGIVSASVYPNPGTGQFRVDLPDIMSSVSIVNIKGAEVYRAEAKGALPVDLRNQPPGLYIIRVANAQGIYSGKVVVQ